MTIQEWTMENRKWKTKNENRAWSHLIFHFLFSIFHFDYLPRDHCSAYADSLFAGTASR
jgi:hypothetical protein